jgi:Chaperone of endosialidase
MGHANTATGHNTLGSNTTGSDNTATGGGVLASNTTASENTGRGHHALNANTIGVNNTATGSLALASNTTGGNNTATGFQALALNTTGSNNTATGFDALVNNTTATFNVAYGESALFSNTTGGANTAIGSGALVHNTTASLNTAVGTNALFSNTAGNNNIALGNSAGTNLTTGSNNIDIGSQGVAAEANTIRIGTAGTQTKTVIAGIFSKGVASASGVNVKIDSTGRLGTVLSSARYKEAIKPMDKSSEAILALKPVSFRYKKQLDPDGVRQFGLIAEDVEKVNPDLVIRDEEGKVMSVRYEAVNAMLLNEFLKEHQRAAEEHRKVEEQGTTIAQLKRQIEALTATVQKVSDQVALSKPAPQLVANQ